MEGVDLEQMSLLNELEELCLLALIYIGDNAYGVTIADAIEEAKGSGVSTGALYRSLERLQKAGYARSWQGEKTKQRGGRPKRFYAIEPAGVRALGDLERTRRQLVPKLA